MSLRGYEDLQCPQCDGKEFIAVNALQWKEGSGTSPRPQGWHCVKCQKTVDVGSLIQAAKRRHRIEELKELENAV